MNSPHRESYWGSVLFYKHLILITLLLMILIPTCLSIFFGILSYRQGQTIDSLLASMDDVTTTLSDTSVLDISEAPYLEEVPLPADPVLDVDAPSYQMLYPDLYTTLPDTQVSAEVPTIYLTFDDGPSSVTLDILDVLAEKGVTATFFVQGTNLETESGQEILKMIADAGHTIGVHTYTHDYTTVYASVESFLEDFYLTWTKIIEITGVTPTIYRFPGGSINVYNATISQDIISEMLRRGFVYFDWNASADDSITSTIASTDSIYAASISASKYDRIVLLMHDSITKTTTAEALPDIIDFYAAEDYEFQPLSPSIKPVVYNYLY